MEALVLGLSSGLVCVVSCGPVVAPWLALEGAAWGTTSRLLTRFLAGRLAGYLAFGGLAWGVGRALAAASAGSAALFAVAHLGLAVALAGYALPRKARCEAGCAHPSTPGRAASSRRFTPLALGLFTGLSPCPPFFAAGVRAAESASLGGALAFFALFFTGTLVWFAPFTAIAALRRFGDVQTVARFTTLLVALYYAYLGTTTLGGVLLDG